jgi:glucoamylase
LEQGEQLYVTGNAPEMGAWSTQTDVAPGPFLCPQPPACFLDISVPAGQALEYKFVVIGRDGKARWQEKESHKYTVPEDGTGFAEVGRTDN